MEQNETMDQESAILSAGAVALSTSATVCALIVTLKAKGVLSDRDEIELYELALTMLGGDQADDESGVFEMARDLIERQLKPGSQ